MSRKRPFLPKLASGGSDVGGGGGGLYDFLPEPDPTKEVAAKASAKIKELPKLPPEDKSLVIFLDIDGVLLPAGHTEMVFVDGEYVPFMGAADTDFNALAMANLRTIVQQTGATLVLSSEWRKTEARRDAIGMALRRYDIPQLRDCTTATLKVRPELLKGDNAIAWCERRTREIGEWLSRHPGVKSWVAIDDVDFSWADGVRQRGTPLVKIRAVRTHPEKCLSEEDARRAVHILLNPPILTTEQEAALERRAQKRTQMAMVAAKKADKEKKQRTDTSVVELL